MYAIQESRTQCVALVASITRAGFYLVDQGPAQGHVLNRRQRQVEGIHVVLGEDTHAQRRVHADVAHLRGQLALQQVDQRGLRACIV